MISSLETTILYADDEAFFPLTRNLRFPVIGAVGEYVKADTTFSIPPAVYVSTVPINVVPIRISAIPRLFANVYAKSTL